MEVQEENLRLKEANLESVKQIDANAKLKELRQTLETTKASGSEGLDTLHEEREHLESN